MSRHFTWTLFPSPKLAFVERKCWKTIAFSEPEKSSKRCKMFNIASLKWFRILIMKMNSNLQFFSSSLAIHRFFSCRLTVEFNQLNSILHPDFSIYLDQLWPRARSNTFLTNIFRDNVNCVDDARAKMHFHIKLALIAWNVSQIDIIYNLSRSLDSCKISL